ncbi:hypothetical protein DFA_07656 [Cavenderia fasciculata]|uniref:Uncharacterized protein n=1 Tax=Cavenderia fasciculata TaxID=261658 RepID=F4Q2J9_CACFS|nr:uncharacterized protein DFA_07656 [Cavenderia fasciculata]EGG16678.1 hypothetical protein DFA_07656 [Cavenderia fasciculata]|eukprot:XP_004355152.1 hypothetical protein DFA_07656 [Cavenderia fasciculata]
MIAILDNYDFVKDDFKYFARETLYRKPYNIKHIALDRITPSSAKNSIQSYRWLDGIKDNIYLQARFGFKSTLIDSLLKLEQQYSRYIWFDKKNNDNLQQQQQQQQESGDNNNNYNNNNNDKVEKIGFVPNLFKIIENACIGERVDIVEYIYHRYHRHLPEVIMYIYQSSIIHGPLKSFLFIYHLHPDQSYIREITNYARFIDQDVLLYCLSNFGIPSFGDQQGVYRYKHQPPSWYYTSPSYDVDNIKISDIIIDTCQSLHNNNNYNDIYNIDTYRVDVVQYLHSIGKSNFWAVRDAAKLNNFETYKYLNSVHREQVCDSLDTIFPFITLECFKIVLEAHLKDSIRPSLIDLLEYLINQFPRHPFYFDLWQSVRAQDHSMEIAKLLISNFEFNNNINNNNNNNNNHNQNNNNNINDLHFIIDWARINFKDFNKETMIYLLKKAIEYKSIGISIYNPLEEERIYLKRG